MSAVPLIGVVELVLHVRQTSSVVPDSDWIEARRIVAAELAPDDLVTFAPSWTDPLGRRFFGPDIATPKRAARSDERRFRRAFEVSIRGAHDATLAGWKKVSEKRAGAVTITVLENPSYTKVVEDLVDLVRPDRLSVQRADGAECPYSRGSSAGGSTVVPQGMLVPAEKFVCQGGHVGVAVMHDLEHRGRLCISASPGVRMRFKDVTFSDAIFGHSGVQWVAERAPDPQKPERTELTLTTGEGRPLVVHTHRLGVGWVGFEIPTEEYAGKKMDLVAEVSGSQQRYFCFEASTREVPK